jgi:hypothetical protein
MSRKIEMIEISEILYRWVKGTSVRSISRSLGVSRNTLKEILKAAKYHGLNPVVSSNEDIADVAKIITLSRRKKIRPNDTEIKISPWHDQLSIWNEQSNMTITQMIRLLSEKGFDISDTSLRRYFNKHFTKPKDITIHLETIPGKQAQVDYGYVGMLLDPVSNKLRKAYAFIMTLSHSRYRFVYFVFRQDVATWIDCHVRSFNFFGGVVETVLLDNLKAGVLKPNILLRR